MNLLISNSDRGFKSDTSIHRFLGVGRSLTNTEILASIFVNSKSVSELLRRRTATSCFVGYKLGSTHNVVFVKSGGPHTRLGEIFFQNTRPPTEWTQKKTNSFTLTVYSCECNFNCVVALISAESEDNYKKPKNLACVGIQNVNG